MPWFDESELRKIDPDETLFVPCVRRNGAIHPVDAIVQEGSSAAYIECAELLAQGHNAFVVRIKSADLKRVFGLCEHADD